MMQDQGKLYSGIISVGLLAFSLTIFEVIFFYKIGLKNIQNQVKSIKLDIKKDIPPTMLPILRQVNQGNVDLEERNLRKINRGIMSNVIAILLVIALLILLSVIFLVMETGSIRSFDMSALYSSIIVLAFIIAFQIYFYKKITLNYKYISGFELSHHLKEKLASL